MKYTPEELNVLQVNFQTIAKEPLTLEQTENGFTVRAFGSELACLRLGYAYRRRPEDRPLCQVSFDHTRNSWFFRLDTTS